MGFSSLEGNCNCRLYSAALISMVDLYNHLFSGFNPAHYGIPAAKLHARVSIINYLFWVHGGSRTESGWLQRKSYVTAKSFTLQTKTHSFKLCQV